MANAKITRRPNACGEFKYPGVPKRSLHIVDEKPFKAAGTEIIPIRVFHGQLPILGFRIGNMAYLTDVKDLPESEFEKLKDLDALVITALRKGAHPTHLSLEESLGYITEIAPKIAYLIHKSHRRGLAL